MSILMPSATASAQLICTIPEDGLTAWYPGNGNTNDLAQDNDGTLRNGATFGDGYIGQAFSLDGDDDDVSAPSTAGTDPTDGGTLAAWIKMDRLPSEAGHIMQVIGKGSEDNDFDLQIDMDDKAYFYVGEGFHIQTQAPLTAGGWIHIAGTWDPEEGMVFYVNGEKTSANVSKPTRVATGELLLIGNQPEFGPRHFEGSIDEVMVFNRGLANGEVADIACVPQVCGDWNNDRFIQAGDALAILRKSVGDLIECPEHRCDTDGNGVIAASDALRALRLSVELEIEVDCPPMPG